MEKICQHCNQPNPSDAAFCRKCASPLPPSAPGGGHHQPGNVHGNPAPNQPWNQPNYGGGGSNFAQPGSGGGNSQRGLFAVILMGAGFLLCCTPLGLVAAVLGWLEMTAIREGRAPKDGMVMAQIGLWGGIGVTILSIIGYFFVFALGLLSPGY